MLGNNLRYCREELELTQKELGFIFGVHASTISGWETGKDTIPLKKLIKFCNLYGYSLDFVTGLSRNNTKYPKLEKTNLKKIGDKLKQLRLEFGLTQNQLAKECMISQTTYSNYELGLYLINTLTIYTICKNHKISIDYILR